jgi:hypothetical protein
VAVDSKLIAFMDRWDIEKAVTLLRESIDNGIIPNQGVVINLLQNKDVDIMNLSLMNGVLNFLQMCSVFLTLNMVV